MELANTFNHAGCIFFERKRYDEAYDAFCGALQALVISNGDYELARRSKDLLLLDPCIHRAYDRIEMAGLFHSSRRTSTPDQQQDDDGDGSQSSSLVTPARPPNHPQHKEGEHGEDHDEECFSKPIMIPFAPWITTSTKAVNEMVNPETRQQHFAATMTVVWMNKGLVLQRGTLRNLTRSLNCYSLASQWLSSLDELKNSAMVQGLHRALSHNTETLLLEIHRGIQEG